MEGLPFEDYRIEFFIHRFRFYCTTLPGAALFIDDVEGDATYVKMAEHILGWHMFLAFSALVPPE